jgi:HEAT repeat protein
MHFLVAAFSLDHLISSYLLLAIFALIALLAILSYPIGLLGWLFRQIGALAKGCATLGFRVWRVLFSWAPWPVFLALVGALHYLAWSDGEYPNLRLILAALGLMFMGVVACLAYVYLDLERYEVGRGYKTLYNPLKGQEIAVDLARYGSRVGIPLLAVATLATVSGFALLNQGLYQTIGRDWYALKVDRSGSSGAATVAGAVGSLSASQPQGAWTAAATLSTLPAAPDEPGYSDFLAYTLINLSRVVDLLDIAHTYNVAHITYVHQARWPASTLLILFKLFFTFVLLQQIFTSVRQYKLLGEAVQEYWSPHPPIQERARSILAQFGDSAVKPLLESLKSVQFLTAEQRAQLPPLLADMGPTVSPVLVKQLRDPNENVRAISVTALGHLHALEALPAMARLAQDSSEWVRQGLVEALEIICRSGTHVIQKKLYLRLAFQASRRWVGWVVRFRRWVLRHRLANPVELAVTTLRALAVDQATMVRSKAVLALGQLGPGAKSAAPELTRLLQDEDESVRCQAAEVLAKVSGGSAETVTALSSLLADASAEVRMAAARALGSLKDDAAPAVPRLVPLLQDPEEPVRQTVAEALSQIGHLEEQEQQLVKGLTSRDNVVRAQTAEALGTIGATAADTVPALIEALKDSNDRVRVKAAQALGKMGEAAAESVPALIQALRDEDSRVGTQAAQALGQVGETARAALPALQDALRHLNVELRAQAASALGKLGRAASSALPALRQAAHDKEGVVRSQAVLSLGELGSRDAAVEFCLLDALEDPDPQVRVAAVTSLGRRELPSDAVINALLTALQDTNHQIKVEVTRVLPRLAGGTPAVVEGLCELLKDDTPEVQVSAVLALGKLGPPAQAAGEPLLRALQTGAAPLREQVLRAFALIQPPQALTAFQAGLKDGEADLRKLASAGLMKTPEIPQEVLPALVEALKDPEVQVRSNVASVLSRLGKLPDEAIPLLIECTSNADDGLRLNAMRALQAVSPEVVRDVIPRLIDDTNVHVRLLAARFLLTVDVNHARAVEVVTEALGDPGQQLRKRAQEVIESLRAEGIQFRESTGEATSSAKGSGTSPTGL